MLRRGPNAARPGRKKGSRLRVVLLAAVLLVGLVWIWAPAAVAQDVSPWATTTAYPMQVAGQSCVEYNSTVYCVGGRSFNGPVNSAYYASLTQNGIGQWSPTTGYPLAMAYGSCVAIGSYVYCVGGETPNGPFDAVYYASLSANGIGAWTSAVHYPGPIFDQSCVGDAGSLYCVGGQNSTSPTNAVYYAQIDSSTGAITSWTPATSYPTTIFNESCASLNGSMYCVGGDTETASQGRSTSAVYRAVGSGSSLQWGTTTPYPVPVEKADSVTQYYPVPSTSQPAPILVGGEDVNSSGVTYYDSVGYAQAASSGFGSWNMSVHSYPIAVSAGACVAGGFPSAQPSRYYIYCVGGYDGSAYRSEAYYAELAAPAATTTVVSTTTMYSTTTVNVVTTQTVVSTYTVTNTGQGASTGAGQGGLSIIDYAAVVLAAAVVGGSAFVTRAKKKGGKGKKGTPASPARPGPGPKEPGGGGGGDAPPEHFHDGGTMTYAAVHSRGGVTPPEPTPGMPKDQVQADIRFTRPSPGGKAEAEPGTLTFHVTADKYVSGNGQTSSPRPSTFHPTADTGGVNQPAPQQNVAEAKATFVKERIGASSPKPEPVPPPPPSSLVTQGNHDGDPNPADNPPVPSDSSAPLPTATEKIVSLHHPPFSADAHHAGSQTMIDNVPSPADDSAGAGGYWHMHTMQGRITDSKGAGVKGLQVGLTNEKGARLHAVTGDDGSFRFSDLKPGNYTLNVGDYSGQVSMKKPPPPPPPPPPKAPPQPHNIHLVVPGF